MGCHFNLGFIKIWAANVCKLESDRKIYKFETNIQDLQLACTQSLMSDAAMDAQLEFLLAEACQISLPLGLKQNKLLPKPPATHRDPDLVKKNHSCCMVQGLFQVITSFNPKPASSLGLYMFSELTFTPFAAFSSPVHWNLDQSQPSFQTWLFQVIASFQPRAFFFFFFDSLLVTNGTPNKCLTGSTSSLKPVTAW